MLTSHLQSKKILVTGGAGFLGRHVVESLLDQGVSRQNIFVARSIDYDLRIRSEADQLIADSKPDIVIAIAARLSGIGDNIDRPAQYFLDNINIGLNLIEASRLWGIQKLVYIGTVCSYPRDIEVPFRELDLWNGYPEPSNAPYGIAKRAVGSYLQAAYQQYGFKSVQLILTNLYGPHDDFREKTSHVIPALIKKVVAAKHQGANNIEAWGDGSPTRDFLYVTDAAEGIVKATAMYDDVTPVNLASGKEISIRDLLHSIVAQVGYVGDILWDHSKPNGQPRRVLDVSKAHSGFAFKPKVNIEQGLKETIRWYSDNRDWVDQLGDKYSN